MFTLYYYFLFINFLQLSVHIRGLFYSVVAVFYFESYLGESDDLVKQYFRLLISSFHLDMQCLSLNKGNYKNMLEVPTQPRFSPDLSPSE